MPPPLRYRQVTCLTQANLEKRSLDIPFEKRLDIPPGVTRTLCDIKGPGRIVRIWMTLPTTGRGSILRDAVLRAFWDDEPEASVECPLGDFFGAPFGRPVDFVASRLAIKGGGYLCFFEMPFHTATHGVTVRSFPTGRVSAYRLMTHDPIPFDESIEITFDHGVGNDMISDYASVAWWYQSEPHQPSPRLTERRMRRPGSVVPNLLQFSIGVGIVAALVVALVWLARVGLTP